MNILIKNAATSALLAEYRNAALEEAAKVADAEERKRLTNSRACQAGSLEWGDDPKEAGLVQEHKAITARNISNAIRSLQEQK